MTVPLEPDADGWSPSSHAYDLGGGTWYTKAVDQDGTWVGINEWHRHPATGKWCGGWVPFDIPANAHRSTKWQVESWGPLTLSPSLLCTMPQCGHHGFVVGGYWRSC